MTSPSRPSRYLTSCQCRCLRRLAARCADHVGAVRIWLGYVVHVEAPVRHGHAAAAAAAADLENYGDLGGAGFGRAAAVTALMTAVILVGQLTFSVLAAYAFARLEFPGRDALFWVYIATLMVPGTVTVVPMYLMMAQLGLRNTFWALVLPFMFGSPYAIFLLREHFRLIPNDLINAAHLDGANTLDVIVHVVIPSSRPVLAALTLITVVSQWNNFMWPLVITSGHKWRVLTVATADLQSRFNSQWTLVMAATTIAIVPLIVLFMASQRHIVASIVVSGLK